MYGIIVKGVVFVQMSKEIRDDRSPYTVRWDPFIRRVEDREVGVT